MYYTSATQIYPNLWQGAEHAYRNYTIGKLDAIFLMANGCQPPDSEFNDVEVIRVPLEDRNPPKTGTFDRAEQTAHWVANAIMAGKKVLVSCASGYNRSGLVVALALRLLTGNSGIECVKLIQEKRPLALHNQAFVVFVLSLLSTTPLKK
jgi:protein-tyrosine phosphatase